MKNIRFPFSQTYNALLNQKYKNMLKTLSLHTPPSLPFSLSLSLSLIPDNTENYDPDYDFLHQDLSVGDHLPPAPAGGCLSPLPESHIESSSPVPGQLPSHPRFSAPPPQHSEYWSPQPQGVPGGGAHPLSSRRSAPPALPQKKRRSAQVSPYPDGGGGSRLLYERYPSQYDNLSEEEMLATPPFPLFTPSPSNGDVFVPQYESGDVPTSPPPLPGKKAKHSEWREGHECVCVCVCVWGERQEADSRVCTMGLGSEGIQGKLCHFLPSYCMMSRYDVTTRGMSLLMEKVSA